MRAAARPLRHEEDEESVFVSMTDMTVSFLFIVMILLAFFATQFRDQEVVPLPDYEAVVAERDAALIKVLDLSARIEAADVEIVRLSDVLAATEDERDAAREDALTLRQDLEAARLEVVRLQETIAELTAKLTTVAHERDAAQEEAVTLRQRVMDLEAMLRAVRADLVAAEEMLTQLRVQLTALEEEIARLRQPDALEVYLAEVGAERLRLLETLQSQLMMEFPGLNVVISAEGDALRFQGEGLFGSGRYDLAEDRQRVVRRIAERLDAILPCYTLGPRAAWEASCNPGLAVIEAVQIEGHTDDRGGDLSNLQLSALRGSTTYGE